MTYKQKIAEKLGAEGCYFLSLVYLAEQETGKEIDAIASYAEMVSKGLLGEDCYVNDAAGIITALTGKSCTVGHTSNFDRSLYENQRDITCWRRIATEATYYHFVVMDKDGNVEYDPLENSRTVKDGAKYSRRIITIG